jgi:hypothetical protein
MRSDQIDTANDHCDDKLVAPVWRTTDVLDKSKIDKELARRLSAAFISSQMGVSIVSAHLKA